MSGKKSRTKGAVFERLVRNYLAERLGVEVENPAASGFSGADAVVGPFCIEIKNHTRLELPAWWAQALEQAKASEFPVNSRAEA